MLDALRAALTGRPVSALEPLPLRGVAHDHVRLAGTGLVARIPRWSQIGLDPASNLAHQATAFTRAQPSGHTPRLDSVLPPSDGLPMGALLVGEVEGRPPRLPEDLSAIAAALAALHRLPVPPAAGWPPLTGTGDPVAALLTQVERQAGAFDSAGLDPRTRLLLAEEMEHGRASVSGGAAGARRGPVALIGSDVHPGNFLIDDTGKAWFTDLEKAHYSHPAIDLAHATLYTSTRWDPQVDATLSATDVARFVDAWAGAVPSELAGATLTDALRLRRLVWLRTLTWMARWKAEGERLSPGMPSALKEHMARHVDDVLSPDTVERVRAGWLVPGHTPVG